MLTRRSKIKSRLKFIALHLELNGVETLGNCIVVKPRQPHFMIVQWNHRVEEKLLYRGVRLFAYHASKTISLSRAAVRMADISLTEAFSFTAIAASSYPLLQSDSGKKRWKWALASI